MPDFTHVFMDHFYQRTKNRIKAKMIELGNNFQQINMVEIWVQEFEFLKDRYGMSIAIKFNVFMNSKLQEIENMRMEVMVDHALLMPPATPNLRSFR